MKFYASIAAGVCTIWLSFQPDPRIRVRRILEPDLHRIFKISAGHLKKLWTDFDEILCVDSCGGTKKEVHVFFYFRQRKRYMFLSMFVCLSVCLSVC